MNLASARDEDTIDDYYANIDLIVNNLCKLNDPHLHDLQKYDKYQPKPFKKINIAMSSTQIALKKNLTNSEITGSRLSRTSFLNKSSKLKSDFNFDVSSTKTNYSKLRNNNDSDLLNESHNQSIDRANDTNSSKYFTIGNVAGQKLRQLVKKYF